MKEEVKLEEESESHLKLTVVPDITDEATYKRLRAAVEEDIRADRRMADRRALRELGDMLNPLRWFRRK